MTAPQGMNLVRDLEGDLAQKAQAEHDALRKELEETASHNTEPVSIYGGGVPMIVLMYAVALALGGAAVSGSTTTTWQWVLCVVVAVLFLGYSTLLVLKWNKPAMTFTADGILFPGMQKPLPWPDISGCTVDYTGVLIFRAGANIAILLEDEVPQPDISGDWRVQYLPAVPRLQAAQRITVRLLSIRGLSDDAFEELFTGYAASGKARAALKAMETRG